jgi:hypothetical protein
VTADSHVMARIRSQPASARLGPVGQQAGSAERKTTRTACRFNPPDGIAQHDSRSLSLVFLSSFLVITGVRRNLRKCLEWIPFCPSVSLGTPQ